MTTLAPLFKKVESEEASPAFLVVNVKEKTCEFSNGKNSDVGYLYFPVNPQLSEKGMDEIKHRVAIDVVELNKDAYFQPDEEPRFGPRGDRVAERIQATCNSISNMPAYQDQVIGIDQALANMPMHEVWPEGISAEQSMSVLVSKMAADGKHIVGDLPRAFFQKLEEAEEEGLNLTPEQHDFLEEERASQARNPLFQKPTPGGK